METRSAPLEPPQRLYGEILRVTRSYHKQLHLAETPDVQARMETLMSYIGMGSLPHANAIVRIMEQETETFANLKATFPNFPYVAALLASHDGTAQSAQAA